MAVSTREDDKGVSLDELAVHCIDAVVGRIHQELDAFSIRTGANLSTVPRGLAAQTIMRLTTRGDDRLRLRVTVTLEEEL